MDTLLVRFLQPAPLAFATLVAALLGLAIVVALAGPSAGGVHSISDAGTAISPFRWA